jgi:hypothetical protein
MVGERNRIVRGWSHCGGEEPYRKRVEEEVMCCDVLRR